jgi:DNA topoisomerase-1
MRTDSVNFASQAVTDARSLIAKDFGKEYLPAIPKVYTAKSKNAQEAHEAIRPTNLNLHPEKLEGDSFTRDHKRLYELIWKRTMACQMSEAVLDQTAVDVEAKAVASAKDDVYMLRANGSVMKFDGWLKLYGVTQEVEEEKENDGELKKQVLPKVSEGENLDLQELSAAQHFTQPPPR